MSPGIWVAECRGSKVQREELSPPTGILAGIPGPRWSGWGDTQDFLPSETKRQRLGGACDFPQNRAGTCLVFWALLSFLELWDSARGARWGGPWVTGPHFSGRSPPRRRSRASPGQQPFSSFLRAWAPPHLQHEPPLIRAQVGASVGATSHTVCWEPGASLRLLGLYYFILFYLNEFVLLFKNLFTLYFT